MKVVDKTDVPHNHPPINGIPQNSKTELIVYPIAIVIGKYFKTDANSLYFPTLFSKTYP